MKSCLIVDHSEVAGFVTERIFQAMGFSVARTTNSDEALEICTAAPPNLVVIDWKVPGTSAMKFLKTLRDLPLDTQPAVIYCTTENDLEHIEQAIAAGADEYVLKPFTQEIIDSKLQQIGLC